MNEQTTKLIEQLANKLGTTSQYLWGVLVNHAPVSAINSTLSIIAFSVFLFILYRIHKKLMQPTKDSVSRYYEHDGLVPAMVVVCGLSLIVAVVGIVFHIRNMINAIFDPEFWAFRYLLDIIGCK